MNSNAENFTKPLNIKKGKLQWIETVFWGIEIFLCVWISKVVPYNSLNGFAIFLVILMYLISVLGLIFSFPQVCPKSENVRGLIESRRALLTGTFLFEIIILMVIYSFMFKKEIVSEFHNANGEWFVVTISVIEVVKFLVETV